MDGSTSAHPLQVLLACKLLGIECGWGEMFLAGTRSIVPDLESVASPELAQKVEKIFNIRHNGTHDAYVNLIKGQTDFILVARQPSQDELRAARLRAVRLEIQPVALDAFVFLAHVDNPVGSLSLETIRDIYTGRIARWSDLDVELGEDQDDLLRTYRRNPNSGSQELMETLVMKGERMIDAPDMELPSMIGPINAVGQDILGIGYSVYFYAMFMYPDERVKLVGVEGVIPSSSSIADRSYPLTTEVYTVLRADTLVDSPARLLRDWLLTSEGQAVVEESGYVPLFKW